MLHRRRHRHLLRTKYPEFYSFPPFFTIQPALQTRDKQLALWRELILRYYTSRKLQILNLHDCPLWRNDDINRKLSPEDVQVVAEDFVENSGHGEWVDAATRTSIRILWRKPDEFAADIYQWAVRNGYVGQVCTVYELHSGEDNRGQSFEGADEELLRRALAVLERQNKCAVFQGETSQEDGIKFF